MKIAHTADCHWGFGYPGPTPSSRFDDITRSMDYVANQIIAEGCDLTLFSGDAFKDANVRIDRATLEITAFVAWLRKLSDARIDVVVISGTPSHDAISAYELIKEMQIPHVYVITKPNVLQLRGINIACLPGMNRSEFSTQDEYKGLPPHVIHQLMTDQIYETCKDLRSQCTEGLPTILMSHFTYDLADTGFEDALLQNEPILTDQAAKLFDLVALGHIHRPQHAGTNVFYCGTPERHNFGDEHTKTGFYVHEFGGLGYLSKYIDYPHSRRFKTLDWCDMDIQAWLDGQLDDFTATKDAIVRVRYSCSEELQKQFSRQSLEKALYDAGAFFVYEIKAEVERSDRVRDVEVTEALSPLTALQKWAENQGKPQDEIRELQLVTSALLEGVAA